MDSQLATAHRHTHEENPHSTTLPAVPEGENEHHEKSSVLKKVKAKAKKLKDTLGIKKHGHGHDHDHDHDHDPEVEEDDGEEEFEQAPNVQGAPSIYVYESTVTRIVLSLHENKLEQSRDDLGPTPLLRPLEKDPQAPKDRFEAPDPGNYKTKATDPTSTGGKEAGVAPLVSSFGKMGISNEPSEHKPWSSTESHDQLSSGLPPIKTHVTGENSQVILESLNADEPDSHSRTKTHVTGENSQAIPESFNPDEPDSHSPTSNVQEQPNLSSYTEKISAAMSTIVEKGASAKDVVASKLGYGGNDDAAEGGDASKSATAGECGRKVASTVTEKLTLVYDKVAEAGSAVVSKMQGTGTENRCVAVKKYVAEKQRPSDEDKALSEVISEALHTRKGEEPQKVSQTLGKVTESPEVAKRLGPDNDGNTPEGMTSSNKVGKGMVDSFKGTVASWFGDNGEQQLPPQHNTSQEVSHGFSHGAGGCRNEVG